jgi:hypothetical protein
MKFFFTLNCGGLPPARSVTMSMLFFGVGAIPNRQLKSATRSLPVTGGLGEIPEPTVKVRMRENQHVANAPWVRRLLALFTPKFHTYFGEGEADFS